MRNSPSVRRLASSLVFLLAIFTLVLVTSLPAFGQATTGTLRGTVTDPNGGVVAGATVTAKNQSTSNTSPTTTNGEGGFVLSNLQPGAYTVTVETTSGFSKKVITDVNVPIGTTTDLPIALAVGAPTEVVTVTSTGEEVITRDQAQISTTFETRKIEDLPSNGAGGGIDTLALLAPGIVASRNSGVNTDGTGLSVNGNRGRSNNFQIDGSDNNDLSIGGPSLFVDNTSQVAEYQVITNNFSAQYGRNSGAVVNIVTKQGGNDFHGDVSWFHRDAYNLNSLNNLEKRNLPANPTAAQSHPSRDLFNQFGATAGGPIWAPKFGEGGKSLWKGKDRAFFFASYQGIREPQTFIARGTGLAFLPTEFSRLTSTFPGNSAISVITTLGPFAATHGNVRVRTDAAQVAAGGGAVPSRFFFGALPAGCTTRVVAVGGTPPAACAAVAYATLINPATGAPFLTGGSYDVVNLGTAAAPNLFQTGFAERDFSAPFTENEWSYRLTFRVTDKDNVDFRHLYQKQLFVNNGGQSNGFSYDVPATSKNLGGTWTRQIGNAIVNEFKATTQDLAVEFGGADPAFGAFAVPAPASIGDTIANITFGGTLVGVKNTSTALATIGHATNIPQGRLVKVYQFADTLSWSKGKHSLVMGAEYKHLINKVPFLPLYQGQFTFSTTSAVTRLANNAPSAVSLTAGEPVTTYVENDQYYFFQDDFKIKPNLTLNLGVRYEYTGQPINQLHDITVERESGSKNIFNSALPLSVRTIPFVPADKNNFAPRVGFAYTPHFWKKLFGEDATVIRGGFAIAYDPAFYNILLNLQNVAPYSAALALSSANALASTTTSPLPLPLNPTGTHNQALAAASGVLPLGQLDPRYLSQTQVSPGFHSPYSEQFSFGIQRQVNASHVFEVRYVGTQGVDLFQNVNGNFFIRPLVQGVDLTGVLGANYSFPSFSNLLPAGTTFQTCANLAATPFVDESTCNGRQFRTAGVTIRDNGAHSTYHSMQTRYAGRFLKNNLSINASYTWSKTIDNASEIFAFADISSANSQNPFDRGRGERALSNLNRPHAFSASFIYDVPIYKDQRGFVGHLLGGWQLNGVQVSTSGNPFTPNEVGTNGAYGLGTAYLTSGDRPFISNPNAPANTVAIAATDAWALYADSPFVDGNSTVFYSVNTHNQGGGWVPVNVNDVRFVINSLGSAKIFHTPFGTMPRNYLSGPGINQLNMSVFKTTKISERLKVQFQASAFNVLNHPNPGYGVNARTTTTPSGYLPNAALENAGSKLGNAFNDFGDINLASRVIQFGLRIIY